MEGVKPYVETRMGSVEEGLSNVEMGKSVGDGVKVVWEKIMRLVEMGERVIAGRE